MQIWAKHIARWVLSLKKKPSVYILKRGAEEQAKILNYRKCT